MPFITIIPARYAANRLPGKPLAEVGGVPMIVRVATQARQSRSSRVVIATDDERIAQVTRAADFETVITRSDHVSGTDRLAEAIDLLGLSDNCVVVNVQGDEPFIPPALIDQVAEELMMHEDAAMATICHPISAYEEFHNPNVVKVVLDRWNYASYFSRAPIPFTRDSGDAGWLDAYPAEHLPYRHCGVYAYRASFLRLFPTLTPAPTERIEKLEQLRALWHGYRISVLITEQSLAFGIDTEQDLKAANEMLLRQKHNNS